MQQTFYQQEQLFYIIHHCTTQTEVSSRNVMHSGSGGGEGATISIVS